MARNDYSIPNGGAPDTPGGTPSGGSYPPFSVSFPSDGASIPQGYVYSPTMPPDSDNAGFQNPVYQTPAAGCSPTEPLEGNGETQIITDVADEQSVKLVVGWLVCIDGPCKGQDFRLHAGWNYIGRSNTLDVYLNDTSISRQRVVKVDYDPNSRTFGVAPCEGPQSLSYLNGKPLRGDRDFEAYDRLKIGNSELVLIPFCSDKFAWGDQK